MMNLITILAICIVSFDPTSAFSQFRGGNPGNFCYQNIDKSLKEIEMLLNAQIFPDQQTKEYIAYLRSESVFIDVENLKDKVILLQGNQAEVTCVLVDCNYQSKKSPNDIGITMNDTLIYYNISVLEENPIKVALFTSQARTTIYHNCQLDL